jgi:F-type H+-transporting ATPase subunit a
MGTATHIFSAFRANLRWVVLLFCIPFVQGFAAGGHGEGGEFDAGGMIMHHILDTHEWHVAGELTIPLPIMLWDKQEGLQVFMSSKFEHGHADHNGYAIDHEQIGVRQADGSIDTSAVIDISITKNVVTLFMVLLLMLWIFTSVAKAYKKRGNAAPKGMQSLFEPIIVFIRDEVAKPVIGEHKYARFMPFLLTVFFFIWIANLLGLVPFLPGGANLTGNIAVTLVLATFSFIIILASANGNYWRHIFAMPSPTLIEAIRFVRLALSPSLIPSAEPRSTTPTLSSSRFSTIPCSPVENSMSSPDCTLESP